VKSSAKRLLPTKFGGPTKPGVGVPVGIGRGAVTAPILGDAGGAGVPVGMGTGAVSEAARVNVAALRVCCALTSAVTVVMGNPPAAVTTTTMGVAVGTALRVASTARATRVGSAETQAVKSMRARQGRSRFM
jgi:hypothetical protein